MTYIRTLTNSVVSYPVCHVCVIRVIYHTKCHIYIVAAKTFYTRSLHQLIHKYLD